MHLSCFIIDPLLFTLLKPRCWCLMVHLGHCWKFNAEEFRVHNVCGLLNCTNTRTLWDRCCSFGDKCFTFWLFARPHSVCDYMYISSSIFKSNLSFAIHLTIPLHVEIPLNAQPAQLTYIFIDGNRYILSIIGSSYYTAVTCVILILRIFWGVKSLSL